MSVSETVATQRVSSSEKIPGVVVYIPDKIDRKLIFSWSLAQSFSILASSGQSTGKRTWNCHGSTRVAIYEYRRDSGWGTCMSRTTAVVLLHFAGFPKLLPGDSGRGRHYGRECSMRPRFLNIAGTRRRRATWRRKAWSTAIGGCLMFSNVSLSLRGLAAGSAQAGSSNMYQTWGCLRPLSLIPVLHRKTPNPATKPTLRR